MPHTFTNVLIHAIFSTKERIACIDDQLKPRLHAYLGGILQELHAIPLCIGGVSDHVHLLIATPASLSLSDMMRLLKTNSSKWVHEQWPTRREFAWQKGYGAFSVSQSNAERVKAYISNQEMHHRKMSFQEEFLAFLRRHGIAYDPRYVWE